MHIFDFLYIYIRFHTFRICPCMNMIMIPLGALIIIRSLCQHLERAHWDSFVRNIRNTQTHTHKISESFTYKTKVICLQTLPPKMCKCTRLLLHQQDSSSISKIFLCLPPCRSNSLITTQPKPRDLQATRGESPGHSSSLTVSSSSKLVPKSHFTLSAFDNPAPKLPKTW